jgi:hypothetical protein
MKKVIICILSLFCVTSAMAQEPIICGDWIGIARDASMKEHPETGSIMRVDEKLYIRIKQNKGRYQVRMKGQIADGSRPFDYQPECKVTSVSENTIKWSQDWGSNDDDDLGREQGVVVGRDSQIAYFTAVLTDGVLHLSAKYIITYYDRQGRVITSKEFPFSYSKGVTLYKEESDW